MAENIHGHDPTTGRIITIKARDMQDGTNSGFIELPYSSNALQNRIANPGINTPFAVIAANGRRTAQGFFNDSANNLLLSLNGDASATNWFFKIGPGGYYETSTVNWKGSISGMFDGNGGSVNVTEFV